MYHTIKNDSSTMIHPDWRPLLGLIQPAFRVTGNNAGAIANRWFPRLSQPARSIAAAMTVIVLAGFPIVSAARLMRTDGLRPASGPVDHHRAGYGHFWELLRLAQTHVPVGSSFTVRAPTPATEMHLYMIALGQLRGRHAYPSSYYRRPLPEVGAEAQYVVVLSGTDMSLEPDLELVAANKDGSVFRRAGTP